MRVVKFTDEEILEAIKSGGSQREKAIAYIYQDTTLQNRVIQFARTNSGNTEDGQDLFHEGIIVLDRNIRQEKFRGESSLQGYLYSICRFLWMNQIRKNKRITLTDDNAVMDTPEMETPEVVLFSDEKKNTLQQILGQLGEKCQQIMELWKLSYSMEEIADKLGFSSPAMARKNKYRCHKSLLKLLEENPALTQLLKE